MSSPFSISFVVWDAKPTSIGLSSNFLSFNSFSLSSSFLSPRDGSFCHHVTSMIPWCLHFCLTVITSFLVNNALLSPIFFIQITGVVSYSYVIDTAVFLESHIDKYLSFLFKSPDFSSQFSCALLILVDQGFTVIFMFTNKFTNPWITVNFYPVSLIYPWNHGKPHYTLHFIMQQ